MSILAQIYGFRADNCMNILSDWKYKIFLLGKAPFGLTKKIKPQATVSIIYILYR